jgi:transcriptional regulator with XRE-family HTH domain
MNPVRTLRERTRLTQAALARTAGTSQPAIAAYEAGRKSPTVGTVERLAAAAGLEAAFDFVPPLTREDRRSLALHRAIAARLAADPGPILDHARRNLERMAPAGAPRSQLLREWDVLLQRPVAALLPVLIDPGPWARELRHVTPFAGILTAPERAGVYRSFASESGGQ